MKFLEAQDAALVKNLTTGAFAKSIAMNQEAEAQSMTNQINANYASNMSTISAFSAVVYSGIGTAAARNRDTASMTQANNQSVTSLNQAIEYKAQQEQLLSMNAGFAEAYGKVSEQQFEVVMTMLGTEEIVRAGSLAELREKFKVIYKRAAGRL